MPLAVKRPDSELAMLRCTSITLGRLKMPHLKQKQNRILKQYETKRKQMISSAIARTVRIDGAFIGTTVSADLERNKNGLGFNILYA